MMILMRAHAVVVSAELGQQRPLRHSEHAHLLSDIEKLTLPILGSVFPFWSPTGDLVCRLEPTSRKG